ncbi:MAG: universal stress protein [Thermodesulfobacteriota bacterium]|nr:universal stress protein [Thermodesulfobacteriota bacterium]
MVQQFKKILFPTDLSEHARYSFNYAASIAAHYRASIVILYVVEGDAPQNTRNMLSVFLGSEKMRELEKRQDEYALDAKDILIGKKQDAEVIRDGLNLLYEDAKNQFFDHESPDDEILVKRGDIVHKIFSVAKSRNCDLIVMGHGKYPTLTEAVIGSTTKSILKKSTVPVLVIPMPRGNG